MKKCKLSELATIVQGQSPKSEYYTYDNLKTPFLQGNRTFGDKYPFIDTYTNKITKLALKNSVLMSVRAPVGDLNIATENCCIGRGLCSINALNGDNEFIYYLLKHNIKSILNKGNGTTYDSINKEQIENLEIKLPSEKNQYLRNISNLLTTLDNKIELNIQANVELESMAKTIFDYSFLQFEFSNEEGKPYKSSGGKMVWNDELGIEIPEGWSVKKLGEIFNFIKGKIPDKIEMKQNINFLQYLTIDVVNGGIPGYCNKESMVIANGEVIMVMDGAASSEVYVGNTGVLGSTFCKLEIKSTKVHNNFLFLIMKKYESIFKMVNTGSTVPHANKNYINDTMVALPSNDSIMLSLQKDICLYIDMIIANKKENRQLSTLRDFLLPLLMNGQVTFKDNISAKEIEGNKKRVKA